MFFVITITSLRNGQRGSAITVTGAVKFHKMTSEQVYKEALAKAVLRWRAEYPNVDIDGYVVDFYSVQENLLLSR
jgi:hypothetical protein